MPRKDTKTSKKQVALKVVYPENLQIFYSNYASFSMSGFDLTIDFGIRHENVAQMNSRVILSPQHAKAFLERIKNLLETYEKEFGEIVAEPKSKK